MGLLYHLVDKSAVLCLVDVMFLMHEMRRQRNLN